MKFIKNLDKTIKKTLKTKHIRLISAVILLFIVFSNVKGVSKVLSILNNPIFKIGITLLILYISSRDIKSAILLFIVYIIILHSINKNQVDTFINTNLTASSLTEYKKTDDNINAWITGRQNSLTQLNNATKNKQDVATPSQS